jgi:hypothetical protein
MFQPPASPARTLGTSAANCADVAAILMSNHARGTRNGFLHAKNYSGHSLEGIDFNKHEEAGQPETAAYRH